jgi:acetyl-CoA synthetase
VKRLTAPYKYPREIYFCTDLPKTISGKIRRSELRRRTREQSSTVDACRVDKVDEAS